MLTEVQSHQSYEQRIQNIKRHIHEHINEPLKRETLAALAGFSVAHFHRVFTGYVGENVTAYVRHVRMERAGRKLRMGAVDIGEIALAAGYATHTAFGKAFKQHFGLSPSAFRQLDCHAATQLLKKEKS